MKTRGFFFLYWIIVYLFVYQPTLYSDSIVWNDITYDDETVSKLITVVTTTNPIPSIPLVNHLYFCQKSLFKIPALAKCNKIIVFDGIQPGYESRENDYVMYKKKIRRLTRYDSYFKNTELIFCSSWVHLAGAIKEALEHVKTPFVFIQQHDFNIIKDFDLNGIVATMAANPHIKHVKIDYNSTNDSVNWWNGPVDEVVEGIHFVPLTRTFGWSDVTHVSTVAYYRDFVLPQCQHGCMEHFLHSSFKKDIEQEGFSVHKNYGTYLYGKMKDGGYIYHSDGRNSQ